MSETKVVSLADIRIDGETQPRVTISERTVSEYGELMRAGIVLPPIDVFFDGVDHWLADGFHRYFAAQQIRALYLTANVHVGLRRDAVLFAVGANHGHGLQRTNADKRKAVLTLLQDEEWGAWSNVEIAKRCGVSEHLPRDARESLRQSRSEESAPRTYTTKHGTEATMKVEKIGKSGKQRIEQVSALQGKIAAAAEGAPRSATRRLPGKSDLDLVTNVMFSLDGINSVMEGIDVAALANHPSAALWRETAARTVAVLRAFTRSLERKTA